MERQMKRIAPLLLSVLLLVMSLVGCSKGWKEYVEVSDL